MAAEFRKSLLLFVGSTLLWLALAEGICRLLPVHTGYEVQPVDAANPIVRFHPNRDFLFSRGPLLTNVNRGHVNNYGFVNDQHYETGDKRPLLAVIGDSYIEAGMVPYPLTLQGRLAGQQNGNRRVYSFGSSGSSLLDYLYYAIYARQQFGAEWLVINVVGNDFDEMLLRYKQAPAFHYFAEAPDGGLSPMLLDYPSGLAAQPAASFRPRALCLLQHRQRLACGEPADSRAGSASLVVQRADRDGECGVTGVRRQYRQRLPTRAGRAVAAGDPLGARPSAREGRASGVAHLVPDGRLSEL